MPSEGIFNTTNIEELKPEVGFTPRQHELIENSVESLLFGEINGDLMLIIESICTTETQANAVKRLIKKSLRHQNGWFKSMLQKWVKEPQIAVVNIEGITIDSKVDIDKFAKEVMAIANKQ